MYSVTTLMDTAETIARERGFEAFSFADLAVTLGIEKSGIYDHFQTKAQLARELITRYSGRFADALAEVDASTTTAQERMTALVGLYRGALGEGQSMCLCVSFSCRANILPQEVRQTIEVFRKDTTDWLTKVYELGQTDGSIVTMRPPADEAATTFALLEGAQIAAHAAKDVTIFDLAVKHLTEAPQTVN